MARALSRRCTVRPRPATAARIHARRDDDAAAERDGRADDEEQDEEAAAAEKQGGQAAAAGGRQQAAANIELKVLAAERALQFNFTHPPALPSFDPQPASQPVT